MYNKIFLPLFVCSAIFVYIVQAQTAPQKSLLPKPGFNYTDFCTYVTGPIYEKSGRAVFEYQRVLQAHVYSKIVPTGHYGKATIFYTRLWQKDVKIFPSGFVGPQTIFKLRNAFCFGAPGVTEETEDNIDEDPTLDEPTTNPPVSTSTQPVVITPTPTPTPVIPDPIEDDEFIDEEDGKENTGGTMRLGTYKCYIEKNTLAEKTFKKSQGGTLRQKAQQDI